jgi:hypothetical protein
MLWTILGTCPDGLVRLLKEKRTIMKALLSVYDKTGVVELAAKQAAALAEAQASFLVCGGGAPESFSFAPLPEEVKTWRGRGAALWRAITLEPIPEEMRTTSLRFQAAKRVVCAQFRR